MHKRLVDLHPTWFVSSWKDAQGLLHESTGRNGMGIIFDCPVCGSEYCFVGISFENPVDGLPPGQGDRNLWKREGTTFEELTLTPSILVRLPDENDKEKLKEHWHGFVTKGIVT